MGWRSAVKDALDRPRARWALTPLASVHMTVKARVPCLVWPTRGGWLHRYPGGQFVWDDIGAPPPTLLDRHTEDVFLFACELRPGDTVVDVGAGVGEEATKFSRLVGPTGRVIAVEAHPGTFGLLVRNCRYNRLDNVEPVHRAVSDRSEVVRLSDGGSSVAHRVVRSGDGVPVAASSLDDLVEGLGIGRVALLKMNIEGAERLAIRGMDRLVQRTDAMCISCHDFLAGPEADESLRTKDLVTNFLRQRGFSIRTRDDDPRPWVRDYVYGTRPRA